MVKFVGKWLNAQNPQRGFPVTSEHWTKIQWEMGTTQRGKTSNPRKPSLRSKRMLRNNPWANHVRPKGLGKSAKSSKRAFPANRDPERAHQKVDLLSSGADWGRSQAVDGLRGDIIAFGPTVHRLVGANWRPSSGISDTELMDTRPFFVAINGGHNSKLGDFWGRQGCWKSINWTFWKYFLATFVPMSNVHRFLICVWAENGLQWRKVIGSIAAPLYDRSGRHL